MKPYLLLTALWLIILVGCSPTYLKLTDQYQSHENALAPDYSDLYYWAAHPDKHDPADSIPRPLRKSYQRDSSVDVFFIHPTTLTAYTDPRLNAPIQDAQLNAKTDYTSILLQGSAFNECNLYAPRYRQAHIRNYFPTDTPTAVKAFDTAYSDVRHAFLYFLQHRPSDRPIIIASHSQGSTHAMHLLREFFDTTSLKNKLVAAYIVGMYIPTNYFKEIQLCTTPEQTGCFLSWRTFKVGYTPEFVQREHPTAAIVNPITWDTAQTWIDRSENKGAILNRFNTRYKKAADAKIEGGILWTRHPHFPFSFLMRYKNYHIGDINLFYYSVRENIRTRVRTFKANHP